jgi:hypothetical protein
MLAVILPALCLAGLLQVGTFEGTYSDCDGSIQCTRGRNDLHFPGNHQRVYGNVTAAPYWPVYLPSWPSPMPAWVPVQPNEHPRILFRRKDIPTMQARARSPIGRFYMQQLAQQLAPGANFSIWQPAAHCLRWLLAENQSDAEQGAHLAEALAAGKPDAIDPRYGMQLMPLRVGPTMWALGLAYDLCFEAWGNGTRSVVANALLSAAQHVSLLASGSPCQPDPPFPGPFPQQCSGEPLVQCVPGNHFCSPVGNGSNPQLGYFSPGKISECGNHLGAIVGGGLAGLLAVEGDFPVQQSPNCSQSCLQEAISWSLAILRLHLRTDWGEHGACTTDVGPEHVTANTGTMPAILALQSAKGLDFLGSDARMSHTLPWWTSIMVRATPQGQANYVHRGTYEPGRVPVPWRRERGGFPA